jgi:hypothetical protein
MPENQNEERDDYDEEMRALRQAILGDDTFDFSNYDATKTGTNEANTDRIMDFVTGSDKFQANILDNASPEYTEVANPNVTSVEDAIALANQQNLFAGPGGSFNDYIFIAGAAHGYLIVNVNNNGSFDAGTDYAVVLQDHNTLDSFGPGDILSVHPVSPP